MYLLTDAGAIAALAERAAAGCDVRVILEPAPYQQDGANQPAYDQLAAAGRRRPLVAAAVHVHPRQGLHRRSRAPGGPDAEPHRRGPRRQPRVRRARRRPDRRRRGGGDLHRRRARRRDGRRPRAGRLISSPESSRPTLLALIGGARASLALETEELTDPAVISALLDARARGVAVTLVWPGPAAGAGAAFSDAGRRRSDRPGRRRAGDSRQGRGRRRPHALPRVGQPDPHLARRQPRARTPRWPSRRPRPRSARSSPPTRLAARRRRPDPPLGARYDGGRDARPTPAARRTGRPTWKSRSSGKSAVNRSTSTGSRRSSSGSDASRRRRCSRPSATCAGW